MTANFTKTPGPSSAIIVIPASKHHHYLLVFSSVSWINVPTFAFSQSVTRAGVAQYMKIEWRVVAIFNIILFLVLVRHSPSPTFNPHEMIYIFIYIYVLLIDIYVSFVVQCSRWYTLSDAVHDEMLPRAWAGAGAVRKLEEDLFMLWVEMFGRPFTRNFEFSSVQIFSFWWNGNKLCSLCTSWAIFFHLWSNALQWRDMSNQLAIVMSYMFHNLIFFKKKENAKTKKGVALAIPPPCPLSLLWGHLHLLSSFLYSHFGRADIPLLLASIDLWNNLKTHRNFLKCIPKWCNNIVPLRSLSFY